MNCFCRSRLLHAGRTLAAAILMFGLVNAAAPLLHAQDSPPPQQGGRRGGGQFAGMQRVAGEVVSVAGANVTVKTEDGSTVTVVTTDNTRIMKGRGGRNGGSADGGPGTVKLADLKPGDGITAAGILDAPNKTLHAALLFAVDAAQVKAMRDNLGKTYIAGKVTAIDLDNAKLTVERPDKVAQTIGLDDSTSFRRGRPGRGGGMGAGGGMFGMGGGAGAQEGAPVDPGESITLADVKVGDQVAGQGEMKAGTFVPKQLVVMTPGQGGGRRRGEGQPVQPAGTAPATPPAGTPPGQ